MTIQSAHSGGTGQLVRARTDELAGTEERIQSKELIQPNVLGDLSEPHELLFEHMAVIDLRNEGFITQDQYIESILDISMRRDKAQCLKLEMFGRFDGQYSLDDIPDRCDRCNRNPSFCLVEHYRFVTEDHVEQLRKYTEEVGCPF